MLIFFANLIAKGIDINTRTIVIINFVNITKIIFY